VIEPVIRDLRKCGLLREDDASEQRRTPRSVCHVIFDLERTDAVKTVHGYLDDIGIAYCGRTAIGDICGRTKASSAASERQHGVGAALGTAIDS